MHVKMDIKKIKDFMGFYSNNRLFLKSHIFYNRLEVIMNSELCFLYVFKVLYNMYFRGFSPYV